MVCRGTTKRERGNQKYENHIFPVASHTVTLCLCTPLSRCTHSVSHCHCLHSQDHTATQPLLHSHDVTLSHCVPSRSQSHSATVYTPTGRLSLCTATATLPHCHCVHRIHCRTDTVYTVTATVYTVICHGVTVYTLTVALSHCDFAHSRSQSQSLCHTVTV
jgi:hypothetical protein